MTTLTYLDAARELLSKAFVELEAGDTRQVSEKGWGAAAQMVKALAEARGWKHDSHAALFNAIDRIVLETGNKPIRTRFAMASSLHQNFYENWRSEAYVLDGLIEVRNFLDGLTPLVKGDFPKDREGGGG